jgi:hypothetical protein
MLTNVTIIIIIHVSNNIFKWILQKHKWLSFKLVLTTFVNFFPIICHQVTSFEMIVGGHGDVNPNSSWLNGKGFWLSYGLGVLLLHLILLCLPFISTAVSWTLTNCIHNLVNNILTYSSLSHGSNQVILLFQFMLIFLHIVKGAPFEPLDQGKTRSLTHWEQIDYGKRFTVTRKFLTVVPVIL